MENMDLYPQRSYKYLQSTTTEMFRHALNSLVITSGSQSCLENKWPSNPTNTTSFTD